MDIRRICVFCGSSLGTRPEYTLMARRLGRELAFRDIGLVFGGGRVGIMGEVARAALNEGGSVIGVIPKALIDRELAFEGLTDLRVVGSMHERKALMGELSDAFIALPGGLGTIEELVEILTWAQLGIHAKPCGILNVAGYYDKLLDFLDHAVDHGFIASSDRGLALVDDSPEALLARFEEYEPPEVGAEAWKS
jgi:uncharacterized protein (TIGR00730 family)